MGLCLYMSPIPHMKVWLGFKFLIFLILKILFFQFIISKSSLKSYSKLFNVTNRLYIDRVPFFHLWLKADFSYQYSNTCVNLSSKVRISSFVWKGNQSLVAHSDRTLTSSSQTSKRLGSSLHFTGHRGHPLNTILGYLWLKSSCFRRNLSKVFFIVSTKVSNLWHKFKVLEKRFDFGNFDFLFDWLFHENHHLQAFYQPERNPRETNWCAHYCWSGK